jgi:hypothetical protein
MMELAFYYVFNHVCRKLSYEEPGRPERENVWWHQLVTYKSSTNMRVVYQ